MGTLRSRPSEGRFVERSIGTLWILSRGESTARCLLVALPDGLELRVLMDDSRLRCERCATHQESFELAARWRERMMERGWVKGMAAGVV